MATPPIEVHFPPLEACFKDQNLLFTWQDVYTSIRDSTSKLPSGTQSFLSDPYSRRLLENPLRPFDVPSSAARSRFDHLTAAINITPDDTATYNIGQIKQDALWLSAIVKIDEVTALRISVLEWQRRPMMGLLARPYSTEDAFDTEGQIRESMFTRASRDAHGDGDTIGAKATMSDHQRQYRLLSLYYAERAYLLKTSERLLSMNITAECAPESVVLLRMKEYLGVKFMPEGDGSRFITAIGKAVETSLNSLDNLTILLDPIGDEDGSSQRHIIELLCLELISLFELIIEVSTLSQKILSAEAVKPFFMLLEDQAFLAPLFNAVVQLSPLLVTVLQAVCSLAAVAILQLRLALDFLSIEFDDEQTLEAPETRGIYLASSDCMKEVHKVIMGFTQNRTRAAALPMLAWSTVLYNMHQFYDITGGDDSDDESGQPSRSRAQSHQWRIDAINGAVRSINDNRAGDQFEPLNTIAACAVSEVQVFEQFSEILPILDQMYGTDSLTIFSNLCRDVLFGLFELSAYLVQYSSETLGAYLSLVGGDRSYWQLHDKGSDEFDSLAESAAAQKLEVFAEWTAQVRFRYPNEKAPFHRFVRALVVNSHLSDERLGELIEFISAASTFMMRLPRDWNNYRPEQPLDDREDLTYRLYADLPFFYSQRNGLSSMLAVTERMVHKPDQSPENCLPAGSMGTLLGDSRPPVLCFDLDDFSPLRYMVGCLCTAIPGNDFVETSSRSPVPLDEISDILGLLASTLLAMHKTGYPMDTSILDATFSEAEPNKNLLEIVAELCETHLEILSASSSDPDSLDVLVHCIEFFHAVALVHPSRIWSILARSKLLEIDGNGGCLGVIVASVEMISGRYEFLIACIRLFEALVTSSLWSGGPTQESKALTRFSQRSSTRSNGDSLPQRVASIVMTNFTRTMLEVFVGSRAWRYTSSNDRAEISGRLAGVFNGILRYVHGFDDETETQRKAVVNVLANSAISISNVLLSTSTSHNVAETILDMLMSGVAGITSPAFVVFDSTLKKQVNAAFELCCTVLSIRFRRDTQTSVLEQQLFKAGPVFARLMVGCAAFRSPVSRLVERLITTSSNLENPPPSLLGNMGAESAKDFLVALGYLDAPFQGVTNEINLWKMLSSVVSSKQQWFAISLITGTVPKDRVRLNVAQEPKSRTISLLSSAIDQLSHVELVEGRPVWKRLSSELALELLQFVASCQNHWAWVSELQKRPKFIDAITKDYIRRLHREPRDSTKNLTNEAAIAATIAEILAMYLYSSPDNEASEKVIQNLQYFERYGVAAPAYNSSLHSNLKAHLEKQHKGLRLENFKNTQTFPTSFGDNYCYDLPFATQVLASRRSAKGKALQGLEKDLAAANEDLSYVDAQILLLTKWKLLATELVKTVKPDTPLSAVLIDVIKGCLAHNAASNVPHTLFDRLRHHRLELATNILQKLVMLEFKSLEQITQLKSLFEVAWTAIRTSASDPDFDSVFAGEDVVYYRALLRVLFLALRPLTKPTPQAKRDPATHAPAQANELIEVLVYVIIKGFKSLTSVLHEDMSRSQASDYVLLTAMLQLMLKVPGIDLLYSQIALHFANNNTSGHATSLFSWADRFVTDGDPIYGELAILFLLAMSSIPSVAETLAVDGVLSQIASANIMQLYNRAKGMGPFDNPSRMHSIWTRGILPFCLNLLDAVGAPIAAEVVTFLNNSPAQLRRLGNEIANRSAIVGTRPGDTHITLGLASETHSLSLIWLVIERYKVAGIASGMSMQDLPSLAWDKAGIKDDVEDWIKGRTLLGPLVVPANERDADLMRLRPLGCEVKAINRLEERIMAELVAAGECLKGDGS